MTLPGLVAQWVASQTTEPGVASLSHTFMGIDHEIISKVILLFPRIHEGLLSVTSERMCMKYW